MDLDHPAVSGDVAHREPGFELVAFLLARLAEDETVARSALADLPVNDEDDAAQFWAMDQDSGNLWPSHVVHRSAWSPTRVLAECEARRLLVEDHRDQHECPGWPIATAWPYVGCRVLRLLALSYADHEAYRSSWRLA